jgi:hypothetical protein
MFEVLSIWGIDLESALFLTFDAHVNVSRRVDLNFTMAIADGFQTGGGCDEVWDEFVGNLGSCNGRTEQEQGGEGVQMVGHKVRGTGLRLGRW